MEKVLVIGNKKYENLNLSSLIDSNYFDKIYRCNFGLPKKATGTKYGTLALCNHTHRFFVDTKTPLKEIIKIYGVDGIEEDFLTNFYTRFQKEKHNFEKIYYQSSSAARYNEILKRHDCPLAFKRQPRTGHAVVMELIEEKKQVFIFGFTIEQDETRVSYGVKPGMSDKSPFHSKEEEVNILRWLHSNSIIDASLCLLKDKDRISFCLDKNLKPTREIKNILKEHS